MYLHTKFSIFETCIKMTGILYNHASGTAPHGKEKEIVEFP